MNIVTEVPAAMAAGVQPMVPRMPDGSSGLSQLTVLVSKKLPPGAICAID
jgi:hypothetical protein